MPLKKDIIRLGDYVKVINPAWIVRYGYENNLGDTCDEVMEKYSVPISKFILEIESTEQPDRLGRYREVLRQERYRFASAIAYHLVGMRMKSGSERKLFYLEDDKKEKHGLFQFHSTYPEGQIEQVTQVKIVKTGKYYSRTYESSDWGDGFRDVIPGGLSKEKTHNLLRIGYSDCWIEATNVEKLHGFKPAAPVPYTKDIW